MKKMLSLFFSAVMFTSLIPATAFAEASDQAQITESSLAVQSGSEIIDSGTWGTCPWELTSDGTLTVHPGEGEGNFSTQLKSPWFRHTSRIERVIFTDVGLDKVIAPYHCDYLFANMSRLKTVDFSGLDASEGVDAYGMFTDCPLLKSIRWPAPGYLKIKNTGRRYSNRIDEYVNGGGHEAGMFEGCSSLVEVDWNAVDLSEMYFAGGMFAGCTSLEKVVFPEDKSPTGLMSASSMFENCSTLDSLDLSSFTVDRYPIVCSMFKGCSALKSVKLPSFLTGGPWQGTGVGPNSYVDHMFDGCTSLTEVDTSKLAVERVRDTDGMFRGCSSLVSIDLSSMGAVSQSRKYMFEGCTSLEHLKLCRMCPVPPNDGINMFYSIFEGCDNLTQIDGPCGFLTYTPTGYDCHHLSSTGLKRNAWVSATTGKRYTLGGILGTDAKDDEGTEFIAVPDDISAFNIKAATYHNYTYDGTAKNPGVFSYWLLYLAL